MHNFQLYAYESEDLGLTYVALAAKEFELMVIGQWLKCDCKEPAHDVFKPIGAVVHKPGSIKFNSMRDALQVLGPEKLDCAQYSVALVLESVSEQLTAEMALVASSIAQKLGLVDQPEDPTGRVTLNSPISLN